MDKHIQWPAEVSEYVGQWFREFHSPAFLFTNREGRVVSQGGSLAHFGLAELHEGEQATKKAYFLEGLLPSDRATSVLSQVETAPGVFADIHIFRVGTNDCILLLDVSAEVAGRSQIEQALRHTMEQLRDAEKMEALGRLAGGVAHDFNNLLTVIVGYSVMLEDAMIVGKDKEAAREIGMAAKSAAELTQGLLGFSRRQVRRTDVLDLNQLISELEPLIRRLIGEDIVLSVMLDRPLGFVEVDRGHMEQVLMNLSANARDAMPGGGRLVIRTSNVFVDETFLRTNPTVRLSLGPHVRYSVSDTGCGMDAQTMAHAFEPFFTSKRAGHGTGLGLSIVYGLIAQAGGSIKLTSQVGNGTVVEVFLPAVQKTPARRSSKQPSAMSTGTETVLLVEDEGQVRNLIREVLTGLGYKVLEYSNPYEAVALCEHYEGRIDLLLTDLVMPQMNGSELASRIRGTRPEMRVLCVSGYSMEAVVKRGIQLPGRIFLEKPFTPTVLAERVREALA